MRYYGVALSVLHGRLSATRAKAENAPLPTHGRLAARPAEELGFDVNHAHFAGYRVRDLLCPLDVVKSPLGAGVTGAGVDVRHTGVQRHCRTSFRHLARRKHDP
jgi:hypothetical protein